jgi:DNA-binding transcriptional MerR regulator
MRIGEVAEQAGVSVETLRYYERRGLLPEPIRSVGGHRDYDSDTVRFVRAVKETQSLGFSLAEIEEYLDLTRRDPTSASAAVRERLEGKLDEVDAKVAALQTMRAGLHRALDEVWYTLGHSTSTAAYLASGGRGPELGTGPLHVTNGESVASTLRATSLGGVVLSWDDVLHVGPLAFEPAESRRVRACFLADHGWSAEEAIRSELERRDELLERAAGAGVPLVLWFEHDLFDQLQLLQVLSQLPDGVSVELLQADDFLGPLDAAAPERIWSSRRSLDTKTALAARRWWLAVCSEETELVLGEDTSALPYLEPAMRRLVEERAQPSRTKLQLLRALAGGPKTPLQLFVANQAMEGAPFLGDTWCFLFLYELAQDGKIRATGGGRVPLPPPRGDHERFATTVLELA